MHLTSLSVSNFRNIANLEVGFSPQVNILYGDNASGKTNLLEAIFIVCLGRSQRGANDQVLVKQGEEVYRLVGKMATGDGEHEVAVAYQKRGRKKITIDQVSVRASELFENFSAVSLGPEDANILSGPPSVRRNFLDMYLSQFSQTYLSLLVDYHQALSQKNACLKVESDPEPFNSLLVDYGAEIMVTRSSFLQELHRRAAQIYSDIAAGQSLSITYEPSVHLEEGQQLEKVKEAFANALNRYAEKESILKTSLVGPHRDEILFRIGSYPARTHGSQGEWRTAAIAVKLAVYQILRDQKKKHPILLLDEVFAELDEKRAAALMNSFGKFGQVFVTTAVEPRESLGQESKRFRIHDGTIVEEG